MMLSVRRPGAALAPLPAARGVATAALAVFALSLAQGGYFPNAWRYGALALGAAAALFALWTPALRTSFARSGGLRRPALVLALPGLLAALLLWSAASTTWSVAPSVSWLDTQRTLLYAVAAVAFLLAGDGLPVGVVLGATAVAGWALGGRVLHGSHWDTYEGLALSGPLGYANALGVLAAIGAVVTLVLALERRSPVLLAPLAVLLPALALTSSRASFATAVVGAVVGVALVRGKLPVAVGAVLASAGLLAALLLFTPAQAGDRAAYWSVARDVASTHPLGGAGAGTFAVEYARLPAAHDAHSLYLQAAAELGAVGLLLVLAIVLLPLGTALRRLAAAPAAGLTVYALHAGVDWDWQMPAVTLAALALAVAALRRRPER